VTGSTSLQNNDESNHQKRKEKKNNIRKGNLIEIARGASENKEGGTSLSREGLEDDKEAEPEEDEDPQRRDVLWPTDQHWISIRKNEIRRVSTLAGSKNKEATGSIVELDLGFFQILEYSYFKIKTNISGESRKEGERRT